MKHLAFNTAKHGWNVVVSNHRGLGGVSVTVSTEDLMHSIYQNIVYFFILLKVIMSPIPLFSVEINIWYFRCVIACFNFE